MKIHRVAVRNEFDLIGRIFAPRAFIDERYDLTNRLMTGKLRNQIGWPLFGIIRTPQANNIDVDSPLGIPIFTDAMQELRDLDIAYSRNSKEIKSNIEKLYEFIMDNGGQESFDRFIAFLQGAAAVGVNLKEAQEA